MSTENLKVVATADISGLKAGMNDARKELASTAVAATNYSNNLKNVTSILQGQYDRLRNLASLPGLTFNQYERINNNLRKVKSELDNVNKSFKNVVPGSSQAANALTNLGRVAQDAPFGFIGIQNNLNPLLESFQRLKAETGSTGSALKSLAGSLIGPAGLGFALSAASALFLAFGPAIKDFINNTTAAEKAQQALNDKLGESEASVAGNLARLSALVAIAKDVSRSDNERKEALGALNKEYDGFNGKLTLANINTAEATRLINAQTAAIVRQAKIKGIEDLISEQTAKNIKVENQELEKNLSLWDNIKIAALSGGNVTIANSKAIVKSLENRSKSLKEGEAAINSYSDVLKKLLSEEAIDGTLFKEKNVKPITPKSISVKPKKVKVETDKDTKLEFGLQALAKPEPIEIKIAPKLANKSTAVQQLLSEIDRVQKLAAERLKGFNDIVQNTLTSGLSGVGESIAKAITGDGSFGDIFKGIFASLGSGLRELGQYLIKTYGLIQLVKKIGFKNPIAGIAAGFGLVILGSLIQSAVSKQKAFATGVRGFEGGTALVGERGPELVQLPRGSNVVPNAQTLAMSGGGNLVVDYKVINGKDLAIILKRTNEFNSRNY